MDANLPTVDGDTYNGPDCTSTPTQTSTADLWCAPGPPQAVHGAQGSQLRGPATTGLPTPRMLLAGPCWLSCGPARAWSTQKKENAQGALEAAHGKHQGVHARVQVIPVRVLPRLALPTPAAAPRADAAAVRRVCWDAFTDSTGAMAYYTVQAFRTGRRGSDSLTSVSRLVNVGLQTSYQFTGLDLQVPSLPCTGPCACRQRVQGDRVGAGRLSRQGQPCSLCWARGQRVPALCRFGAASTPLCAVTGPTSSC